MRVLESQYSNVCLIYPFSYRIYTHIDRSSLCLSISLMVNIYRSGNFLNYARPSLKASASLILSSKCQCVHLKGCFRKNEKHAIVEGGGCLRLLHLKQERGRQWVKTNRELKHGIYLCTWIIIKSFYLYYCWPDAQSTMKHFVFSTHASAKTILEKKYVFQVQCSDNYCLQTTKSWS